MGSNIFNILFVVGTSALITPVAFESKFIVDSIVAVAAGALLWIFSFRGRSLNRVEGGLLLLGYLGYFIYYCKSKSLGKWREMDGISRTLFKVARLFHCNAGKAV